MFGGSSTGLLMASPLRGKDFPGGSDGKSICLQRGRPGFDRWVWKILWRRKWQPTPVFLPGKSHGQRSLAGCSPRGRRELDTTERLHLRAMRNISSVLSSVLSSLDWKTCILMILSIDLLLLSAHPNPKPPSVLLPAILFGTGLVPWLLMRKPCGDLLLLGPTSVWRVLLIHQESTTFSTQSLGWAVHSTHRAKESPSLSVLSSFPGLLGGLGNFLPIPCSSYGSQGLGVQALSTETYLVAIITLLQPPDVASSQVHNFYSFS